MVQQLRFPRSAGLDDGEVGGPVGRRRVLSAATAIVPSEQIVDPIAEAVVLERPVVGGLSNLIFLHPGSDEIPFGAISLLQTAQGLFHGLIVGQVCSAKVKTEAAPKMR